MVRIPGSSIGYAPLVIPIAFVLSGYFVLESRNHEEKLRRYLSKG